ncbi:MAG: ubiquinol-cytochrome C chaperone family protein [Parvularculaceae bacterium]
MILPFLRKDPNREAAQALYGRAVGQARLPIFYEELGVADTVEGRSELVMLHVFLVLTRLKSEGGARQLGRCVSEAFFENMDDSLREAGVGDLVVGRKIRALAEGLHGRMAAYDAAIEEGAETGALESALARNVYFSPDRRAAVQLARYVWASAADLAAQPFESLAQGIIRFPTPEGAAP